MRGGGVWTGVGGGRAGAGGEWIAAGGGWRAHGPGQGGVQAGQPPRSLRRSGLQMLQDCPKARREVELHWRASQCPHIVRIVDVYENLYAGRKCLLIVMEW